MLNKFPISKITLALLSLAAAPLSQAAGLDRSGQDITGFFNEGVYAEIDYAYISTDITGHDDGSAIGISPTKDEYVQGKPLIILQMTLIPLCAMGSKLM